MKACCVFVLILLHTIVYINNVESLCKIKKSECLDGCCSFPKCCNLAPCCLADNGSEIVENIWSLINDEEMTDNLRELRSQLINIAKITHQQGPAISASLWATDLLRGLTEIEPPPSCVYVNLIKRTVAEREGCSEGLAKAIADYGTLCQQGTNFTRTDNLRAIGCLKKEPINPLPKICRMKSKLLKKFLSMDDVPNELKDIIMKLHKSKDIRDIRVSSSIPAAFSEYAVRKFNTMMSSEVYRSHLYYKGCTYRIPKKCCLIRSKKFNIVLNEVASYDRQVIAEIIASLPKEAQGENHLEDET